MYHISLAVIWCLTMYELDIIEDSVWLICLKTSLPNLGTYVKLPANIMCSAQYTSRWKFQPPKSTYKHKGKPSKSIAFDLLFETFDLDC
jgi:hypothetical protein